MKCIFSIGFCLLFFQTLSQFNEFESLLNKGKDEFKIEFEQQNFEHAVDCLQKAVKLQPKNPEAHYFLGYALSRLNSKDGTSLVTMSKELVVKSSKEFELVNRLSPSYSGELLGLDPYSKISSEWGALALNYLYKNQTDSARNALIEGKSRGGFSNFILALNRRVLDLCAPNSLLITSGDNCTFPLIYLQVLEKYRTDVTIVDISLLNTKWYPQFLINKYQVRFGISGQPLEKLEYVACNEKNVKIHYRTDHFFSWTIQPKYGYLFRSDQLLLKLIQLNKFSKEVFFTKGFKESDRLNLKDNLMSMMLIDRLNYDMQVGLSHESNMTLIKSILPLYRDVNKLSRDELYLVDGFRFTLLTEIDKCLRSDHVREAKEIMALFELELGFQLFKSQIEPVKKYYDELKSQLK